MKDMPLISIVIANYNYGCFLEDAIQSVIMQGFGNQIELIICDAASTDNSVEIIKKYANGLPPNVPLSTYIASVAAGINHKFPITWWCSEPDKGQSDAFNKGFAHANGRYLTWLNADDILLPGALAVVSEAIRRNPNCPWFVGGTVACNSEMVVQDVAIPHRLSWRRVAARDVTVGGPSSFFTKELVDSVGGVDVDLHYSMDIDLWVKFVVWAKAKYKRVPGLVWGFRNHENSKTSGYMVAPESRENQLKKENQVSEFHKRHKRFGGPNRFIRMIQWWPVSILDIILRIILLRKYRGTDARGNMGKMEQSWIFSWFMKVVG